MTNRVEALLKSIQVDRFPICIAKLRIAVQTYTECAQEATITKRANYLANVLDKIPILIEDNELIVGNAASKPMGLEIDPEYGVWTQDEIDALKQENYEISPEDEAELRLLNDFKLKSLIGGLSEVIAGDERLWQFMRSGVILPPWKSKTEGGGGGYAQSGLGLGPGFFLMAIDIPRVLNQGLNSIIAEAEHELETVRHYGDDSLSKVRYLKSVILVHRAAIRFANRMANLAASMAKSESDLERRYELERIAEICRWVPANPARNFREAMQAFWFVFLLITPSPTAAAGRFDQYMYPFYKRDKEAGLITDEDVIELLECIRIKDMQLNRTSGKNNRKKNAGMAKWHNFTIGGVTAQGEDASNELTYLILEAAQRTKLPHHTVTLRVHEGTPEKLMIKALETVKTGIGMPAFVGDESYTAFFMRYGVPVEQAREYVLTGCLDANIPAISRTSAISMFIVPLVFEIFMHNGINPHTGAQVGIQTGELESYKSYEEFLAGFKRQLRYFLELTAEKDNIELLVDRELFPDPFRSSLMVDGVKTGRDVLDRTLPFENGAVLNPVGMINVADSLAAVKKLVYEDKKLSIGRLREALAADWKGYEDVHKWCLAVPKYGNGDRYVDAVAADLYKFWVDTADELPTVLGSTHKATAISITSHQPGGAMTGATPDGRFAGEI